MSEINCYALLFADRVIREDNGKIGVIGIFEQFYVPAVPFQPLPWALYAAFDNVPQGTYVMTVNLVHEATQAVILPITVNLNQAGDGAVQLPLPVVGLRFPEFGRYWLMVNVNGTLVASRVLNVKKLETNPGA